MVHVECTISLPITGQYEMTVIKLVDLLSDGLLDPRTLAEPINQVLGGWVSTMCGAVSRRGFK